MTPRVAVRCLRWGGYLLLFYAVSLVGQEVGFGTGKPNDSTSAKVSSALKKVPTPDFASGGRVFGIQGAEQNTFKQAGKNIR